jgi:hypothetical protein
MGGRRKEEGDRRKKEGGEGGRVKSKRGAWVGVWVGMGGGSKVRESGGRKSC